MPKLTAIVAMDPNRLIGNDGDLPWHLPEDLKFFKATTSGATIVMGRKTFDSIGRPLPNRRNIVLTRDESWTHDGVTVIHSVDDLNVLSNDAKPIFIIGGSEIYSIFLPFVYKLIVSHVHIQYQGDTFFPEFESLFKNKRDLLKEKEFTVVEYCK